MPVARPAVPLLAGLALLGLVSGCRSGSARGRAAPTPASRVAAPATSPTYGAVPVHAQVPTYAAPPSYAPPPATRYAPRPGGVFDARDVPLDQAIADARRAGKPLALFFLAPSWCGWCRKLEDETLPDPSVRAELGGWYVVRYDADGSVGRALAGRYASHGLPTVTFLSSSGAPMGEQSGFAEPPRFVAKLQSVRR